MQPDAESALERAEKNFSNHLLENFLEIGAGVKVGYEPYTNQIAFSTVQFIVHNALKREAYQAVRVLSEKVRNEARWFKNKESIDLATVTKRFSNRCDAIILKSYVDAFVSGDHGKCARLKAKFPEMAARLPAQESAETLQTCLFKACQRWRLFNFEGSLSCQDRLTPSPSNQTFWTAFARAVSIIEKEPLKTFPASVKPRSPTGP